MMQEHDYDPELNDIAARLVAERPVPHPAFRGELKRRLMSAKQRNQSAPARLRLAITAYAGSGAALLAVAAAGLAGIGPFGA